MLTTSQLRDLWAPPCTPSLLTTIPFGTDGARITVRTACVGAFRSLALVMGAHNYRIRPADSGAYNCLAAETLVMTPEGDVPISDLAGTTARLLTRSAQGGPGRWTDAEVREFAAQRLYRVVLSRRKVTREIYATVDHRWLLDEPDRLDQERTTADLIPGQRLASVYPQSVASRVGLSSIGVAHGIVFGDGTTTTDEGRVMLCGPKNAALVRFFPEPHVLTYDAGLLVGQLPRSWKRLPSLDEGSSYLYGFLAGYFAADGNVTKGGVPRLDCADPDTLASVRVVCTRLGIATTGITVRKRQGIHGEVTPIYSLSLSGRTLTDSFFVLPAHRERFLAAPKRYHPARWRVVSIDATDRHEPTYCAVVPGTECFALADNLLTGNCRRITGGTGFSLHAYGIASDTNWQTNPYGPTLVTDRPAGMVADIADIRTVDGLPIFRWGGTYSGSKDAMHDEIVVTPAQLARGIAPLPGVHMPLSAEDLNAIRGIVDRNTDEVAKVVKNQSDETRAALQHAHDKSRRVLLDYANAVAAVGGVDPAAVKAKLRPETKAVLDAVD